MDLNNLKMVNDKFGHAAGSKLIRAAAKKLIGSVKGTDWIFRVGGDEFIVLMPNTTLENALQRSHQIALSIGKIKRYQHLLV